jgi:hypothetical protein
MNQATGRLAALLVGLALAAAGCAPSGDGKAKAKVADSAKGDGGKDGTKQGPPDHPEPQAFVGTFLKALGEGKAGPEMLTAAFKKKIAQPRAGNEEDKKLGYNARALESFLDKAGAGRFEELKMGQAAAGPYFFGTVTSAAGRPEKCLIRLASESGGWKVDWFHRSTAKGTDYDAGADPEAAGASLTAHEFLENLLGGDLHLAEAALSRDWKVRNYGSNTPSDADLGYNQSLVLQKLRGWKGDFGEFTLTRQDAVVAGKPATFTGELTDAAKKVKKAFTLTASKGENGEWAVDEFKIQ